MSMAELFSNTAYLVDVYYRHATIIYGHCQAQSQGIRQVLRRSIISRSPLVYIIHTHIHAHIYQYNRLQPAPRGIPLMGPLDIPVLSLLISLVACIYTLLLLIVQRTLSPADKERDGALAAQVHGPRVRAPRHLQRSAEQARA